ncbi:alpha-tocopherol transfer protein-like [Phlebotomus argentipes]|uniref:alpha-tocopherol transfer protein-like n=1 Tax=Phlebotomus argentipes TaxID=94469 RepID=UPI002892B96A|nr:alpha-tocopherol transfer protein-like [Phlebotomus argentipes]
MTRVTKVSDSRFLSGITEIPSLVIGKHEFVFEADLSEKARRTAEKELRETPERKEESLAELRRLLTQEKDLTWPDNDFWLVKFLRKCKFYPESAFELIKRYYSIKAKHPEYFFGLDVNYYLDIANLKMLQLIPRRDHKGRRVIIVRIVKEFNPEIYSVERLFRAVAVMMEVASSEPDTQVNGVVGVLDLKELSLSHLRPLTPSFIRFGMQWCQNCIPLRLKALHVVNETPIIDATYAIIKNFLVDKLRNRVYFHGKDYEMMHEYLAPNCLLKSYGGTVELIDIPKAEDVLANFTDFALQCEKELDMINSFGYRKVAENTQL